MFHHPLLLNELVSHLNRLKTQTMRGSKLLLILKLTQAFLKMLLSLWNEWYSLTLWGPLLSLESLKLKIGPICLEISKTQWKSWLGNSSQMRDTLVLS